VPDNTLLRKGSEDAAGRPIVESVGPSPEEPAGGLARIETPTAATADLAHAQPFARPVFLGGIAGLA
jgi:hypothetical protein